MHPAANEDGPDGSSIKPVSSLRARFENMSKPSADVPPPHPSPLPLPTSRPISPAPPPPRPKPRDPIVTGLATPVAASHSPTWPSLAPPPDSPGLAGPHHPAVSVAPALLRPSNRLGPPPPLSPRPIPPPSLLVEPPHSPPKGRAGNYAPAGADPSSFFLNPDSVVKIPVSPVPSPRLPKIPSRPQTPTTLDARRSPRLSPSQAPSPPPPRRSAELKRDRELKSAAPPPVNRAEKPKIPSQQLILSAPRLPASPTRATPDRRSPFSTPPSSSESLDEEQPPTLPARPRPHSQQVDRGQLQPPHPKARPRSTAVPLTFEPPPIHHSVASRRVERGQDHGTNGNGPRTFTPQAYANGHGHGHGGDAEGRGVDGVVDDDDETRSERPPLPARPQTVTEPSQIMVRSARLPPRPPRPGADQSSGGTAGNGSLRGSADHYVSSSAPAAGSKRVISNPPASSQGYFHPPPPRTQHNRSMTLDRATAKMPSDYRSSTSALVTVPQGSLGPSTPTDIASRSTDTLVALSSSTASFATTGTTLTDTSIPAAAFPDATNINRRPPFAKQGVAEINTRYDSRQIDICGQRVVTTGQLTRVWSLQDGELLMSLAHGENIKATAVAFKPSVHVDDEGTRVWIGNSAGELMEADIATQSIVTTRPNAHSRHEVVKIYRHYNELWTLDDSGVLYLWGPIDGGEEAAGNAGASSTPAAAAAAAAAASAGGGGGGVPSLSGPQHQSFRLPRGHTFSMVVGDELWHAAGKELRVFLPTLDGKAQFQVLLRALFQEGAGEISAGTVLLSERDKVFFGHTDGKVSIYSRTDYSCVGLVSLGSYKVNTLASAGDYVWAGFNTGRLSVYDTSSTPWVVKKEWAAHENPVVRLMTDRSSAYHAGQLPVVSLGADNMLRTWDGLLQDDWLEEAMQSRDQTYCDFDTVRAHVMTWNAGASTPNSLRYTEDDAAFIQNLLRDSGSPDIFVFGFQELVDLEDKTATAKRILKPKKKEGSDQERMSHQYRDWRDFLVRSLDDYMDGELYHLLQTAHMVGLFTCVFVKADLRDRIRNVATMEVKRGMGGLHGNKGAIAIRFLVDDSSLCFVNCHLAAGQSQAAHRHNDAAAILDSAGLPVERDANVRTDSYTGGGDGTMILDHELCVLNGDLNYRIDTMSRDTVVGAVKAGNLTKLLDRDQLLVARRRNAGFRLRAFEELPIRFAPTYKYDVGTDTYDSSEKKRSPAWCDRLLFRGGRNGRVQQLDYRRHEVRVSDHRPVTGRFALTVKQVDAKRRAVAWMECQQRLEDHREQVMHEERMHYLTHIIGYDTTTSEDLVRERTKRRAKRSPTRQLEA